MAATIMKLAGNVRVPWARLMVTILSSSGWRQHLQHRMSELRQLVEKEHSAVAQRDLARPRDPPPADEAGVGDRVMRRSERAVGDQRRRTREEAGDAVYLGHVEGLVVTQRG